MKRLIAAVVFGLACFFSTGVGSAQDVKVSADAGAKIRVTVEPQRQTLRSRIAEWRSPKVVGVPVMVPAAGTITTAQTVALPVMPTVAQPDPVKRLSVIVERK